MRKIRQGFTAFFSVPPCEEAQLRVIRIRRVLERPGVRHCGFFSKCTTRAAALSRTPFQGHEMRRNSASTRLRGALHAVAAASILFPAANAAWAADATPSNAAPIPEQVVVTASRFQLLGTAETSSQGVVT